MSACEVCGTVLSRYNPGEFCWNHTDWKPIVQELVAAADKVSRHKSCRGEIKPRPVFCSERFVGGGFAEDLDRHDLEAIRSGKWLRGRSL